MKTVLRPLTTGLFAIALAALLSACTVDTFANTFSAPIGAPAAETQTQEGTAQPQTASVPAPLPFTGKLIDGDPHDLPPAVAAALSESGPVTFNYREELTHDHYTVPLALSAFDPLTYVGYPLGSYTVTAFASLGISEGDRVLGDYTAKVHVTRDYTLYYQPTYVELERAARAAVRKKIDDQIYEDAGRLAQEYAAAQPR
jgi:hypothetical protein